MKKKDIEVLKTKSAAELHDLAKALKLEITNLSFEMAQRKVKNVNELRTKTKHRARLLTLIALKKVEEKTKEVTAK